MKKIVLVSSMMMVAGLLQAQERKVVGKTATIRSTIAKKRRGEPEPGRRFNISLGLSLAKSNTKMMVFTDGNGGSAELKRDAMAIGIFVYPKISVLSMEKFSISVGVPVTLAFSGSASSNSRTGTTEESTMSFLYDLPLMIDFNGGVMAPKQRRGEGRIGYFLGVGIGAENTPANYEMTSSGFTGSLSAYENAKSVGPNMHAGFVFRVGSPERPFCVGARVSYKIGMNKDAFNYITPSVFVNM
jgi:hypothetical protein